MEVTSYRGDQEIRTEGKATSPNKSISVKSRSLERAACQVKHRGAKLLILRGAQSAYGGAPASGRFWACPPPSS